MSFNQRLFFSCYGMTDGLLSDYSDETFAAYKKGILMLIDKCKSQSIKLVIITPPIYEENNKFKYDTDVLSVFSEWLCSLPEDDAYFVIDLHSKMKEFHSNNKKQNKNILMTVDRIHWTMETHMFVAKTILDSIGIDITQKYSLSDSSVVSKTPLFRCLFDCRVKRTSAWLKHIGYTRDVTYPPGTGDIVSSESEAIRTLHMAITKR